MTITYPECQIEIDVNEVIELLDYSQRKEPKAKTRQTIGEWAEEMAQKTLQKLIERTDLNRHTDGILSHIIESAIARNPESTKEKEDDPLSGVSFNDPEPQPTSVPYPIEEEPADLPPLRGGALPPLKGGQGDSAGESVEITSAR